MFMGKWKKTPSVKQVSPNLGGLLKGSFKGNVLVSEEADQAGSNMPPLEPFHITQGMTLFFKE